MIDIGLFLASIGSLITLYGVHIFNQSFNPIKARILWAISNPIFTIYFFGRIFGYWNGILSDIVMTGIYAYMSLSTITAIMHEIIEKRKKEVL